jgi:hypothetical protein
MHLNFQNCSCLLLSVTMVNIIPPLFTIQNLMRGFILMMPR